MKHPEKLVTVAENMEKVKDGGLALAIRNSGVNLFDASQLLAANGWSETDGVYSGLPGYLYYIYGPYTGNGLVDGFKPNTQYTLSFKGYSEDDNAVGAKLLTFRFKYSDGTTEDVWIRNNVAKTYVLTSTAGKTVVGLHTTYGKNPVSYVWDIKLEVVNESIFDTLVDRNHRLMPEMNEILSNMNDIYQAGQMSAADLKTSVSGTAISVSDVHTVEHNVGVKLRSKNLALAEDVYKDSSGYAITTFEGRKCVRFLDNAAFRWNGIPFKENTQYTVSFDARITHGEETATQLSALFYFFYSDGTSSKLTSYRNTEWEHFTLTSTAGKTVTSIGLNSYSFYNWPYIDCNSFQLEEGSTETEYTPYITDFTNINPCRNLLNPDYFTGTKIINGITFTDNGDGSITLNGTATSEAVYGCIDSTNPLPLNAATYTLSGGLDSNVWVQGKVVEDDTLAFYGYGTAAKFTLNNDYNFRFNIRVSAGTVCENVQIKPQLELGTTATDYEPYREPVGVEVSRYGKNLLDVPSTFSWTGVYHAHQKTNVKAALKPGVRYVFYFDEVEYSEQSEGLAFVIDNALLTFGCGYATPKTPYYFTLNKEVTKFYIYSNGWFAQGSENVTATVKNLRICVADTDYLNYEPYVEPVTYTAKADGTVEGVKSISPNMTLLTNTPGVIIDAEYFKQSN